MSQGQSSTMEKLDRGSCSETSRTRSTRYQESEPGALKNTLSTDGYQWTEELTGTQTLCSGTSWLPKGEKNMTPLQGGLVAYTLPKSRGMLSRFLSSFLGPAPSHLERLLWLVLTLLLLLQPTLSMKPHSKLPAAGTTEQTARIIQAVNTLEEDFE